MLSICCMLIHLLSNSADSLPISPKANWNLSPKYPIPDPYGTNLRKVRDTVGQEDAWQDSFIEDEAFNKRKKRYVLRKKKWHKNVLTWRLDDHNINEGDEYIIRNTLHRAFHEWSAVSSLRFIEEEGDTDIVIGFERGRHQDAFPFDGRDGVVAHAFYPRDGRLHFDADEEWTLNSNKGVNLFQTATHEIGHLVGLEHSVDPRAAMYAAKRPFDENFTLGDDDVRGIRMLFPPKDEEISSPAESSISDRVDIVENLQHQDNSSKKSSDFPAVTTSSSTELTSTSSNSSEQPSQNWDSSMFDSLPSVPTEIRMAPVRDSISSEESIFPFPLPKTDGSTSAKPFYFL